MVSSSFFKYIQLRCTICCNLQIAYQAKLDNKTQKSRNSGNSVKAPSLLD